MFNGVRYNMAQIHFHSPSEHTFGGGYYAAEAHLVHIDPLTKSKLVLGVMMHETAYSGMAPCKWSSPYSSYVNLFCFYLYT